MTRVAELTAVAALSLVVLLVLYAFATERAGLFKDDTRHYALMAEDPAYLPRLPYTFRVLTPGLVHLLPFDTATGFAIVTVAALWASAVLLYAFLVRLNLGRWPAAGGVVLFLGSGLTIRLLTTPTYVDGLTYLAELAGFYFLLSRRELLFAATLLVGVLNRETILLLAPVYLLQLRSEGRLGRRDLPRVALVLGLPMLLLVAVAAARLIAGGALQFGLGVLETKPRTFEQNVPSLQDLADIYSVFGAAWLLGLANLRQAPPILQRGFVFGLLVVLQLAVSRGDESRNLSHLLPLVIPLAAFELRRFAGAPAAGVALVLACLASTVNFRWTLLPPAALRYGLVAGGTVGALALAAWRRSRAAPGRGGGWVRVRVNPSRPSSPTVDGDRCRAQDCSG
jgi:hypothetical protein